MVDLLKHNSSFIVEKKTNQSIQLKVNQIIAPYLSPQSGIVAIIIADIV